jgi:putative nucleotidyltransferase with HDIG domain
MDRDEAWQTLNQYTKTPALIRHALCVEAAMRHYARLNNADEDQWGLVGLLHDFDYERWPTIPEHTREGAKVLRGAECDEEVVAAILSHVPWNLELYPRDRPIRKTLFAVDELCGFLYAIALVRPQRLEGLKAKSVIKKMKQKAFAAAVSREDIHAGTDLIELPLSEHIDHCIAALQAIADSLDLTLPQEPGD